MKKLTIILLITMFLSSCEERMLKKPYIITAKSYAAAKGYAKLPPDICYYGFNIDHIFQDSCNKYNVGDTIK